MAETLLLTGAAGRVASLLRPMLREQWLVRLTDRAEPPEPVEPSETFIAGDLRDPEFLPSITEGVSAIVHLAAAAGPWADWPSLLETNIDGTARLLEAAREHQVRRIALASSVHAAGGYNTADHWPVQPSWPARPCCPYGVSKVAKEALARLYSDEVDQAHVVCLRFALVGYPVRWRQDARAWLADQDLRTLVSASLTTDRRFGIYFGASDCERPRYDVRPGSELGWQPEVRVSEEGLSDDPNPVPQRCRLWPIS